MKELDYVCTANEVNVLALVASGGVGKSTLMKQMARAHGGRQLPRCEAGTPLVIPQPGYKMNPSTSAYTFIREALKWSDHADPRRGPFG